MESPLMSAAGWTVFHSLWEGAIVAAVLTGVLSLTRSARIRYVTACLALATLLLGFAVTFLVLAPNQLVSSAH
jgi:bla regulator protein blaR1